MQREHETKANSLRQMRCPDSADGPDAAEDTAGRRTALPRAAGLFNCP
jgi:hypothetical protein